MLLLTNSWAKGENDSRKSEIANLDNFAHSENDARKNEIANLDNFAHTENDGRKQVRKTLYSIKMHSTRITFQQWSKFNRSLIKISFEFQDIADINARMNQENAERSAEDKALNDRIDKEIRDRENAVAQLQSR